MKLCLVQVEVGKRGERIAERLAHIERLLVNELGPGQACEVDLILLPECAFSHYCFAGEAEALEKAADEPAILEWARAIVLRYSCYLAFGLVSASTNEARNMLKLVNREGLVCHEQMKRFLYDTDLKWTQAHADAFTTLELRLKSGASVRVLFAICNDINGKSFALRDMNEFALANAALEQRAQCLLLCTAWCSAHPDSPSAAHDAPITITHQLEYWYERLEPLWGANCFFCVADLVGREALTGSRSKRIRYCGTSCVVDMKHLKILGRVGDTQSEQVMVRELTRAEEE